MRGQYYKVLASTVLQSTTQYSSVLQSTTPYYTVLLRTTKYYRVLHSTMRRDSLEMQNTM